MPGITLKDVQAANRRIRPYVRETPTLQLNPPDMGILASVALKLEGFQVSGSFKARGIFNCILTQIEQGRKPARGIVVASVGNAGIAAAYVGKKLQIPTTVYLPTFADRYKVAQIAALGAEVNLEGASFAVTHQAAMLYTDTHDRTLIEPFEQPDAIAGYGTIALELIQQVARPLDAILVPVGGGGLLAGIHAVADARTRIIAIEPESAALHTALAQGAPIAVPSHGLTRTSLGVDRVGSPGFEAASRFPGQIASVSEDAIARSFAYAKENMITADYGAVLGLAALLGGAYEPEVDEMVAVIMTGANVDPVVYSEMW